MFCHNCSSLPLMDLVRPDLSRREANEARNEVMSSLWKASILTAKEQRHNDTTIYSTHSRRNSAVAM